LFRPAPWPRQQPKCALRREIASVRVASSLQKQNRAKCLTSPL